MDDLKLYGKDECELDSFFNTVLVFSTDIGMEFGMKRRGVLILKRGNVKKSVGITLPDNCKMKSVEEDGYKNLEILEYDDLLQGHKKKDLKEEYFGRLKTVQCQWEKYDTCNKFMGSVTREAWSWRSKLK